MIGRRAFLIVVALITFAACGTTTPRTQTAAVDMPPFTEKLARDAREIYRMAWTEDGYPGRLEPDGSIYAHPLYGVYALADYNGQYAAEPAPRLRRAIRTVASAVLSRLEEFEEGLVFWYEATSELSRAYRRHYSALTQAYYATELHKAGNLLDDDELIRAGERAFRSLLVPAERGGVLYKDVHGTSIAEIPQEPNSYILNGWLSALISISNYAELADSDQARDLVEESSQAMLRLLPLYDVPQLANSRYGLSGFLYVRIVSPVRPELMRGEVTVPGEGTFTVPKIEGDPSRWQNHLIDDARANIVVSRASFPDPNQLALRVDSPAEGSAVVQAYANGEYDPRYSGPTNLEWTDIGQVSLREGAQTVRLPLPWEDLSLVVFPTEFGNKRNGNHTNVYHSIHVEGLRKMADITGNSAFTEWSEKWLGYMCRWEDMEVYEGFWANTVDGRHEPVTEICSSGVNS